MRFGPTRLFLAVLISAALLMSGCGTSTPHATVHHVTTHHTTAQTRGVVLSTATGICPNRTIYNKPIPATCHGAREWNASSPLFDTPHALWGVAYAYNCGDRARDFTWSARLPGMDHMALIGAIKHATKGSGYTMFPVKRWNNFLAGVPSEFAVDGKLTQIFLETACTWTVTAIRGTKQDVAGSIPPIPAPAKPWWTS